MTRHADVPTVFTTCGTTRVLGENEIPLDDTWTFAGECTDLDDDCHGVDDKFSCAALDPLKGRCPFLDDALNRSALHCYRVMNASGTMHAMMSCGVKDADEMVMKALEAAAEHSGGVRRPFTLVRLPCQSGVGRAGR